MPDPYVFDEWAVSCENPDCGWCHATDRQERSEREPVACDVCGVVGCVPTDLTHRAEIAFLTVDAKAAARRRPDPSIVRDPWHGTPLCTRCGGCFFGDQTRVDDRGWRVWRFWHRRWRHLECGVHS